jgi:hypothetical protein
MLPEVAPGSVHISEFTFDTALRPDAYPVVLNVTVPGEPSRQFTETTTIQLVPRQLPHRMPVVMWGIGGVTDVVAELPRLKQIGFTHCLGGEVDYKAATSSDVPVSMLSPERVPAAIEMLDTALVNNFRSCGNVALLLRGISEGALAGRSRRQNLQARSIDSKRPQCAESVRNGWCVNREDLCGSSGV